MWRAIGLVAWSVVVGVGCGDPPELWYRSPPDTADTVDTAPDTSQLPEIFESDPPGYQRIKAAGKTFWMGSPQGEVGHEEGEAAHQVTLPRSYWLQSTEVTQKQWEDLMGTAPSAVAGCDDCPVDSVSWWDAIAYVNAKSEVEGLERCYEPEGCNEVKPGMPGEPGYSCSGAMFLGLDCRGYRLPTEAEWEYAARADRVEATYNGNFTNAQFDCSSEPVLDPIAWYCGNPLTAGRTHSVGTRQPNDWLLHDMLGNVWEWVHDWHGGYVTGADVGGPDGGSGRVIRGGSWGGTAQRARAASRYSYDPANRSSGFGFRPARSIP